MGNCVARQAEKDLDCAKGTMAEDLVLEIRISVERLDTRLERRTREDGWFVDFRYLFALL